MTCIECHSTATELVRGDGGHYEKHCRGCGYEWGPFTSNQSQSTTHREDNNSTQPSITNFSENAETDQ